MPLASFFSLPPTNALFNLGKAERKEGVECAVSIIDRAEYLQYRENGEDEDADANAEEAAGGGGLQLDAIIEGFGHAGAQAQGQMEEDEEVPPAAAIGEALLAAAEGEQMRRAVEASEASAHEDEQLRVAIEDSHNL